MLHDLSDVADPRLVIRRSLCLHFEALRLSSCGKHTGLWMWKSGRMAGRLLFVSAAVAGFL